jgi:signal transduction histidine kinase
MVLEQAEILGNYIGSQAVPFILVEDYLSLNELLISSKADIENLNFLFIIKRNGLPIASTFEKGVPEELAGLKLEAEGSAKNFSIGKTPYLVFYSPLLEGELGFLGFGMNMDDIYQGANQNLYRLIFFLLVVLGITITGSFFIGKLIGRPLQRLTRFVHEVPYQEKDLSEEKIFYTQETRTLLNAFGKMMKRIKEADEEKELFNNKMIASERLAAIGTLASGVAHEINNPLNGVEACLKRMNKMTNNPDKLKEYIKSSQNSMSHMKYVIRQLLDFSRPQHYSFRDVKINDLVKNAIELISFRLIKEKIKLTKKLNKKIPPVFGDSHHLSQLFVNLMLNSIDAMTEQGVLNITTDTDGINVIITFTDNGRGIPGNLISKVFDPFFTTKETGKGTGLGLSVSYRIAKEHKGKIDVKSRIGVGTEIAVILPVSDGQTRKNEIIST